MYICLVLFGLMVCYIVCVYNRYPDLLSRLFSVYIYCFLWFPSFTHQVSLCFIISDSPVSSVRVCLYSSIISRLFSSSQCLCACVDSVVVQPHVLLGPRGRHGIQRAAHLHPAPRAYVRYTTLACVHYSVLHCSVDIGVMLYYPCLHLVHVYIYLGIHSNISTNKLTLF